MLHTAPWPGVPPALVPSATLMIRMRRAAGRASRPARRKGHAGQLQEEIMLASYQGTIPALV
jgi:hypothetical protein